MSAHHAPPAVVIQKRASAATTSSIPRATLLRHVRAAWWLIAIGMISGAILGLWSFGEPVSPPQGFADFDDVPRRLTRLAHIAAIALPVLHLSYLRSSAVLEARARLRGCQLMLFGAICLPLLLAVSAFSSACLYLLPIPVTALITAVIVLATRIGDGEVAS